MVAAKPRCVLCGKGRRELECSSAVLAMGMPFRRMVGGKDHLMRAERVGQDAVRVPPEPGRETGQQGDGLDRWCGRQDRFLDEPTVADRE